MPRRKKAVAESSTEVKKKRSLSDLKLGESYTSLFLGIIVVVAAALLLFSFINSRNTGKDTSSQSDSTVAGEDVEKAASKSYEVKEGETLWSIAESTYASGYNWVDIAKANKLENPDLIEAGTKLSLPSVESKEKTVAQENQEAEKEDSLAGNKYEVKDGDYLWDIAVRAYGDGFKWVEIAKANKINNPDVIYKGNVLSLPR